MANTTNYNWETPDDTDLVKDGAAAIRTLGSSVDTTTKALNPSTTLGDIEYRSSTANTNTRLGIGTTGQVLSVVGGVPAWATSDDANAIQNAIVDAKGDLISATAADTPARLGVGANGTVLTADSAEATGLKWVAPAGGASFAGASIYHSTQAQSIANNTATKLTFDSEYYDTNGYANADDKFTIPSGKAGYYRINAQVNNDATTTGYRQIVIYKNGSAVSGFVNYAAGDDYIQIDLVFNLSVADYIEFYFKQTNGNARNVYKQNPSDGYFQISYLGA
jgi:hypothetical protein